MLVDHVSNNISLVRIGRIFEHAALRHLLFFGSGCACREVFFNADASIASCISKSGKSLRTKIDRDVISSSIDFDIASFF